MTMENSILHNNLRTKYRRPKEFPTKVAVVDTETTGLYKTDRIVELAIVILDSATGEIVDEFETLMNPGRDIGPTRVHGITPSMVAAAPLFEEIEHEVAERLNGYILSAHNLAFDQRMLTSEFNRTGTIFEPGKGLCTLQLSKMRLDLACQAYGIPLKSAHRALDDARAATHLLKISLESGPRNLISSTCEPAIVSLSPLCQSAQSVALTRDSLSSQAIELVRLQKAHRLDIVCNDPTVIPYLDLLGLALEDLVLTEQEISELNAEAIRLGLNSNQITLAHELAYGLLMTDIAVGNLPTEKQLMKVLALRLGIDEENICATHLNSTSEEMIPAVCFTGDIFIKGQFFERAKLEQLAIAAGWNLEHSVTRKRCTLLVGDRNSHSSKMEQALRFGIEIASGDQFAALIGL